MTRIRAAIADEGRVGLGVPIVVELPTAAQASTESDPSAPSQAPATGSAESTAAPRVVSASQTLAATSSETLLESAGPLLLGLLVVAVVLLGLAALPASSLGGGLGSLVEQRRLELSLIGVAALTAAIIGLIVSLLAR